MGIINHGVPRELVSLIRQAIHAEVFVEAGTFEGATAAWAAGSFGEVITIEAAPALFAAARARLKAHPNVRCEEGDSRGVLRRLLPTLQRTAVFWLDSHWSGGETYGKTDECPVLDEIELIAAAGGAHAVLIDDARLFLCPPPEPHQPAQWPDLATVLAALARLPGRPWIFVLDDVICAVPGDARPALETFVRRENHTHSERIMREVGWRRGEAGLLRRLLRP
ncbi:MAG: hypothetical protein U0325_03585 [Polyangiales bacterium]